MLSSASFVNGTAFMKDIGFCFWGMFSFSELVTCLPRSVIWSNAKIDWIFRKGLLTQSFVLIVVLYKIILIKHNSLKFDTFNFSFFFTPKYPSPSSSFSPNPQHHCTSIPFLSPVLLLAVLTWQTQQNIHHISDGQDLQKNLQRTIFIEK